ncbi:DUF6152 family protein [Mycobacterium sp.]|uniref:DUF6152 family protein n=1 Tax=Mycobacterium sp. TaxID=1785 RepID=UPI002D815CAA|nr:DUF6152 family protein [Mycobacterium sp.]
MRKHSNWIIVLAAIALMAVAVAAPASAHHGWSEYQDEQFEITGTLVTPVSLAGPHGTAQIQVDDERWELVFAPSTRTAAAGLTEDAIPVGDTVTASGHRHLDEATLEVKTERLTWNDTVFDVYPERN